jgi:diketogulonate reductase-like aldo/keto reductase
LNPGVDSSRQAGVPTIALPSGAAVPVLGQGTWRMAERSSDEAAELDALRRGLDLGLTLIDTAEIYSSGASERLVGQAIEGRRDEVFVVTKVSPSHASRDGVIASCEASLRRLRTDRIDLYLLHWPARPPLEETVDGFRTLVDAGKIVHWGVSNFDVPLLEELLEVPGGSDVAANQVLYNLRRRGIERDLVPWCAARGLPLMAYTPLGDRGLLGDRTLARVAERHGATPAQVALAWILRLELMLAIPKAARRAHVEENRGALDVGLTDEDLSELDAAFPV